MTVAARINSPSTLFFTSERRGKETHASYMQNASVVARYSGDLKLVGVRGQLMDLGVTEGEKYDHCIKMSAVYMYHTYQLIPPDPLFICYEHQRTLVTFILLVSAE